MKKQLFLLFAGFLSYNTFGQNLTFTGATPSLQKADINTEVLTAVIQQKQKEIKQRVLKNSVIRVFRKNDYTQDFNNFASYHYLYNVMDALTTNTSKTTITKSVVENSSEFAIVFAAALYAQEKMGEKNYGMFTNKAQYGKGSGKASAELKISPSNMEAAQTKIVAKPDNLVNKLGVASEVDFDDDAVKNTNLLIDLCYDIIIQDRTWTDSFQFKDDPYKDDEIRKWYESEYGNVFLYDLAQAIANDGENSPKATALKQMRADVEQIIKDVTPEAMAASTHINDLKKFLVDLRKNKYRDFSMTKLQFEGMKYVIDEFLKLAKNKFSNDLVVSVIGNLLDNTTMEFVNDKGVPVNSSKAATSDIGYLSINIESVISSLDAKFSVDNKHSVMTYIRPMFSIGVNYMHFPNQNSLNSTDINTIPTTTTSLPTVALATEKIGVEWLLFNWKYKRSHKAGDLFYYYRHQCVYENPVKQPLFSNLFVNAYAGGLLYNVVKLKSNENFNYALLGASAGLTFFNGLKLSIGAGQAVQKMNNLSFNKNNMYYNIGVDVPILDYLANLKSKKD